MDKSFNYSEFRKFEQAHGQAMWFLIGIFILMGWAFAFIREWALGIESKIISIEAAYMFAFFILVWIFVIPRAGYKFARYICGSWYQIVFGETYADYRKNQKLVRANELLENEK